MWTAKASQLQSRNQPGGSARRIGIESGQMERQSGVQDALEAGDVRPPLDYSLEVPVPV